MRTHVLLVPILVVAGIACAQTPATPTITLADRERALSAIKKWQGFEGTWEGEVRYVAAPKEDWYKQRVFFKVVYKPNEPKVLVRYGALEWKEIGVTYRVYQPDELTLLMHVYGAEGVWTENNVVVMTRRTEHSADVFIQRVVNNWAGKLPPGQDAIYGDSRVGSVRRADHE
jgi:hypothetical protein